MSRESVFTKPSISIVDASVRDIVADGPSTVSNFVNTALLSLRSSQLLDTPTGSKAWQMAETLGGTEWREEVR